MAKSIVSQFFTLVAKNATATAVLLWVMGAHKDPMVIAYMCYLAQKGKGEENG